MGTMNLEERVMRQAMTAGMERLVYQVLFKEETNLQFVYVPKRGMWDWKRQDGYYGESCLVIAEIYDIADLDSSVTVEEMMAESTADTTSERRADVAHQVAHWMIETYYDEYIDSLESELQDLDDVEQWEEETQS